MTRVEKPGLVEKSQFWGVKAAALLLGMSGECLLGQGNYVLEQTWNFEDLGLCSVVKGDDHVRGGGPRTLSESLG